MVSRKRSFCIYDQMAFSRLSGDFNPVHVDALVASRSLFGSAVVHGVHLLMWALDAWCETLTEPYTLISLSVNFLKPVTVGVDVHLSGTVDLEGAKLTLHVSGLPVTAIEFRARRSATAFKFTSVSPQPADPKVLDSIAISTAEGTMSLMMDLLLASELVPSLARVLPAHQIAFMSATSRLVGMECPGLHSLYSELNFAESEVTVSGEECLSYRVKRFDQRFSLATILVSAPGLDGSIKAFLRPEPQSQPGCYEVRAAIDTVSSSGLPFKNQRALVIGGSRGLGEVFAKVLAMGGAEVLLTYHRGQQAAAAIVADIKFSKGNATFMQYDVTAGQCSRLAAFKATHLYYMASPFIGRGQHGQFNPSVFANFCKYYVDGFAATIASARHQGLVAIYYPSSVFLDELPVDMSEYIAAKSAGEVVCASLAKAHPALCFAFPRLPRMATDQTASLLPSTNQAVLPLVMAQLEQFAKETE